MNAQPLPSRRLGRAHSGQSACPICGLATTEPCHHAGEAVNPVWLERSRALALRREWAQMMREQTEAYLR